MPIGKKSKQDGFVKMKEVEFWGLVAIIGEKIKKVKTILRRIGDGNITFWSVMPYSKIKMENKNIYRSGLKKIKIKNASNEVFFIMPGFSLGIP